jgi:hypothetical protein
MKQGIAGKLVVGLLAGGAAVICAGLPAFAEEHYDAGALAKALPSASVSLDRGLRASEREGKPISGKFEVEEGALQLSVYTVKGDKFSEVIVDHKAGTIKKAEAITEADDLKDAREQSAAMAKAKIPLDKAVGDAVKANAGYRAASAMPSLRDGHPVAEITLMKGAEVKKVTAKLD